MNTTHKALHQATTGK